jgi:hypothetical protein
MRVESVALCGQFVLLEPLRHDHVEPLSRVGIDPQMWRWNPSVVTTEDEMRARSAEHLRVASSAAESRTLPFFNGEERRIG